MKIKFFLFCVLLIFSLYPSCNFADSEYQEVLTSQGKVIIGPDKEEAIERFGYPSSATEDFWYYVTPEHFFIYFTPNTISSIQLYPEYGEAPIGFPVEFKAFAYLSNFEIENITPLVQLSVNEPQNFILEKPGVIIPKKAGEYQVLAKYKNIFSNTLYLTVKAESKEKVAVPQKEILLSINILPYKPEVSLGSRLDFIALGTFFDPDGYIYTIRDISEEVKWFTQRDGSIINEKGRQIYFPSLGKLKVFSKYNDLESYPQEAEVRNISSPLTQKLKHITLLPEFMIAPSGNTISLKAFGTYADNKIEDITSMVNWKIRDKEILEMQEKGKFLSKATGITELVAELDNLESSATKVIIAEAQTLKKSSFLSRSGLKEKGGLEGLVQEGLKREQKDLTKDVKKDVEKIRKSFIEEKKKLNFIEIIPDYLSIPLGENRQLVAKGMYSNNSEEDLTLLGEWISSDNRIATVYKGKVSTLSKGEVKIFVEYQEIKSEPASVIVEEPKLVSIILSPQNSQISMKDKLNLKAEGYFSDSSSRDITSLVTWEITGSGIIKIEKGAVQPLKFGETQVFVEYSGIKSLPVNIKVIFTIQWLLEKFFIIISFLILSIIIVAFILYFITKYKMNKLLSLYKNPRQFIIGLYENIMEILIIFGMKCKEVMVPLTFAELIEKKYFIKNCLFLKFTEKFEEAKYSKHILEPEAAAVALNDYNNFLKELFSSYNKFSLILRYCLLLLQRRPLSVYNSPLLANPK